MIDEFDHDDYPSCERDDCSALARRDVESERRASSRSESLHRPAAEQPSGERCNDCDGTRARIAEILDTLSPMVSDQVVKAEAAGVSDGDILGALLLLLERPQIIKKEMERRGLK